LTVDSGLLLGRLVFGLIMAAHGSQKLFGWFGGHGLDGTGAFFESLGWRPGRLFATAAATAEVGGGLLTALGLFGPVGPAIMVSVMVVAMSVHWGNGLFAMSNGVEVPLLYAIASVMLALTGPGARSLDALLGLTPLWTPAVTWTALAVGILGGLANVAIRNVGQKTVAA
jgi:putative oxidoreductase